MVSCEKADIKKYAELVIAENVLSSSKKLCKEALRIDSVFPSAKYYYVYQDSILVAVNGVSENQSLVELYNLNTQTPIRRILPFGRRKTEVVSGFVTLSGKTLLVNDYVASKHAIIDMDSLLTEPKYRINFIETSMHVMTDLVYFKDAIAFENSLCFEDENLGINQGKDRILYYQKADSAFQKLPKYNTENVSQGSLIVNSSKDKLIYASLHQPYYEVYDENLRLVRRVYGPKSFTARYNIHEDDEVMNDITFKGNIPYTYIGYCLNEKNVYLLYSGVIEVAGENKFENTSNYLIVTNWQGDFVDCYNIGEHALSVSVSATQDNVFYTCLLDEEGLPQMYRMYEK